MDIAGRLHTLWKTSSVLQTVQVGSMCNTVSLQIHPRREGLNPCLFDFVILTFISAFSLTLCHKWNDFLPTSWYGKTKCQMCHKQMLLSSFKRGRNDQKWLWHSEKDKQFFFFNYFHCTLGCTNVPLSKGSSNTQFSLGLQPCGGWGTD